MAPTPRQPKTWRSAPGRRDDRRPDASLETIHPTDLTVIELVGRRQARDEARSPGAVLGLPQMAQRRRRGGALGMGRASD